ncbi:hypothetical protein NST84_09845 [Paenibacillus sp. FSL R7-0345]|uniref:hypothetical protein n=1 Tax=Paenibacillus sp. FSL R7-0345 TaxID=2954535 RepID=UPI00315A2A9B
MTTRKIHIELLCELIAANRLGLPLSRMKGYFASADKKRTLLNEMLANKSKLRQQVDYIQRLLRLTEELEQGKHHHVEPEQLYLRMMQ